VILGRVITSTLVHARSLPENLGDVHMAENNIDDVRQRFLRRPPVSSRRLENVGLDLEVPLEHQTTETLPLVANETLGVGYGFDRLYVIDLSSEQPVPTPLPSRHELIKLSRNLNPERLSYGGISGHFGTQGTTPGGAAGSGYPTLIPLAGDRGDFMDTGAGFASNGDPTGLIQLAGVNEFESFARAFIGSGHDVFSRGGSNTFATYISPVVTSDANASENRLVLDPEVLQRPIDADGTISDARRASINTLQYLYNLLSPSAWETVLYNKRIFTEIPKVLPYLDKAFYSLYQRDRIGAFRTKIRDMEVLYTVLGLTEAMYSIRRGRFSNNITGNNHSLVQPRQDAAGAAIGSGVVNPFFMRFRSANRDLLVVPWWLANKLNFGLYLDTDRDEEVRDVERKDITEMMTLLLEAMEVERGLHWGSESNLPMILFDKFKEGQFRDFSDFTDTNASLAATMLGYDSPRDAYYDRQNDYIGRVPYYSNVATSSGQLIGDAKAEFMDRISEMENRTILSPNPEKFKQGMQYTNAFDYTTMVSRTRFGDHSMEVKIHPFGFYRGVLRPASSITQQYNPLDAAAGENEINLVFFPVYNWGQLTSHMNAYGFLPSHMNGAAYAIGTKRSHNEAWTAAVADSQTQLLWPNLTGEDQNYWMPGGNNYSALLLASTDEMFQSWIDRGEQVRAEGATFPSIGPMNLMAEMTYTTPMAMLQRNWPWLRKMSTLASSNPLPTVDDTSYDHMWLGDNMFNMCVEANGPTDLAEQASGTNVVRSGPLALRDRQLFNTASHRRSVGLQLAPLVLPLSKTPENWVGVFQARDAMYFLTSLISEPVMDAYTWNLATSGRTNGMGSARLVTYQGPKTFEGRVEDVYTTPMIGVGLWTDANDVVQMASNDPNFETGQTNGGAAFLNSVWGTTTAGQVQNNYLIFRLSEGAINSGNVLVARSQYGHTSHYGVRYPCTTDQGDARHALYIGDGSIVITEDDFVPGLYWDKLWIPNTPLRDAQPLPWSMMFAHPYHQEATADSCGLTYLQGTTPSPGVPVPIGTDVSTVAAAQFDLNPGYELGQADHTIDEWRMIHVNWIEQSRVNLEYQRAAPSFYVFDLDITDLNESYLRQSLFPLGHSTTGPLTFVGAIGPEGQQVAAETVTGPTVFELSSLTLGAGSLDETPSEPNDQEVGAENPSLHIAEKQDV